MNRGLAHGYEIPTFDLDIGKVGMMICFEFMEDGLAPRNHDA